MRIVINIFYHLENPGNQAVMADLGIVARIHL